MFKLVSKYKPSGNKLKIVLAHNKIFDGQLYLKLKALFSKDHVEYFISY